MLKWCVMGGKNASQTYKPYKSQEAATKAALDEWNLLTEFDKKHREFFGVVLLNLDENGEYINTDESGIGVNADWYDVGLTLTH